MERYETPELKVINYNLEESIMVKGDGNDPGDIISYPFPLDDEDETY